MRRTPRHRYLRHRPPSQTDVTTTIISTAQAAAAVAGAAGAGVNASGLPYLTCAGARFAIRASIGGSEPGPVCSPYTRSVTVTVR
jgi:hypothetical protein